MTCRSTASVALDTLGPEQYPWGCCIHEGVRFVYVYGAAPDYRAAVQAMRGGDHLLKGVCDTLAEARAAAHARATRLAAVFAGIGAGQDLAATACHGELLATPTAVAATGVRGPLGAT